MAHLFEQLPEHVAPPRVSPETPAANSDRSFLIAAPGYAALQTLPDRRGLDEFYPNPLYDKYMRMHKVLVGQKGARLLEDVYTGLSYEHLPRYLEAAGSAAMESALVQSGRPQTDRLALLDGAAGCWQRALAAQQALNESGPGYMIEYSQPFRLALKIATLPLVRQMVNGYVDRTTAKEVYLDCLNVAERNILQLELSLKERQIEALAEHVGFAHECNMLLAHNRWLSGSRFALPSLARSDSGYQYGDQTHDLMVISHDHGNITEVTPVEVKSKPGLRERRRYAALLIRGKMHLCPPNSHSPRVTLEALAADATGHATSQQQVIAHNIGATVDRMVRDYQAGDQLETLPVRSQLKFHDKTVVERNHPGLSVA